MYASELESRRWYHLRYYAGNMRLSTRQVQEYLKRLKEMSKITREGGHKIGY